MGYVLNRRQWLKTSALVVAGFMSGNDFLACRKGPSIPKETPKNDAFILLDNNESPFGIFPNARETIVRSIPLSNRYPHGHYPRLKQLIADRENITPDHIILGAGSTEVMVTLIHSAKTEGEILVGDPTYFDFIYYANRADRKLNKIPLNDKFEHDLEAMEKQISSQTNLIYICNPNNPTASITPKDKLQPFCEHVSNQALVVVDEAYHEYVENGAYSSMIGLIKQGKNVIITRTFSKIFGLAGLRIGYGIAPPEIIKKLKKLSRNFAPIAWLSLQAAMASYPDQTFIQSVKEKNKQVKQYLYQELKKLGLFYIPSHTNFVLFEVNQNAQELAKKLELQKILVRPFRFQERQWIRVSCGTKQELQTLISSLTVLL